MDVNVEDDAVFLGEGAEDMCPPDLVAPDIVFDATFHPSASFLAIGLVTGGIVVHEYRKTETRQVAAMTLHTGAVSAMEFSEQGTHLATCSSDMTLSVLDCQAQAVCSKIAKGKGNPHKVGLSTLNICSEHVIATGDDDGMIVIWDMRSKKPSFKYHEHGDFVSQLLFFSEVNQLISSSGDTCVGAFDMRKGAIIDYSAPRGDELLCMAFIGATNDLICGTPSGLLPVWKFGSWERPYDVHKYHPKECESIVPYNDNIFFTGACDGMVRVIQHYPARRVLCQVGGHDRRRIGVSKIRISSDRNMLAVTGQDRLVQFFDISFMSNDEQLDLLRSRADKRHMATLRAANAESDKQKEREAKLIAQGADSDSDDSDDDDWTSDSDDSDDDDGNDDRGDVDGEEPTAGDDAEAASDDGVDAEAEVDVEDDGATKKKRTAKKKKAPRGEKGAGAAAPPEAPAEDDEPELSRTTKRERVAAAKWLKEAQKERINYRREGAKKRTKGFWSDLL